jgi:predicted Zn-dependent peptidase
MQTISRQLICDYHADNYVGENIIVAAAGNFDHQELHQACERYIAVPKSKAKPTKLVRPTFTSGISALESHLTPLVNMVTVHEAPSFFDNNFFSYLLLQRIISDRPGTDLEL